MNELECRPTFAQVIQPWFTKTFPGIDEKNATRKGFRLEKVIMR